MAVPQHTLLKRFLRRGPSYWRRNTIAKSKNDMVIDYPYVRHTEPDGTTYTVALYLAHHVYLLDRNPAWGSEPISRTVSYQLNTLAEAAKASEYRVILVPKVPTFANAPSVGATTKVASAGKFEYGELYRVGATASKPARREKRREKRTQPAGIYAPDPSLGW